MFELRAVRSRERLARGGLALSVLTTSLDTSMVNTSLPMLARAFGTSFQHAQWIVLAYLVAVTSLTVGAGRLGDIVGRRRLFLASIALFTGMSLICAAAPSLWLLILARGIQGSCAATMVALAMASVADVVPPAYAGRAIGQLAAMSAIGTTLGPLIGGLLTTSGRSAIFLVNVPLGALTFALSSFLPARRRGVAPAAFDPAATLLLALALAAYALSMTLGKGRWGAVNIVLLAAAAGCAGVFALVESRTAVPLLPVAMFRDPSFTASLAANAVVTTVTMATLIVGPFYLSRGLQLTSRRAGLALSIGPATAALTGMLAGRLVARFGPSRAVVGGLSAMIAGSALLVVLPSSLGASGYVAPLVVMTSGYALFQTANNTTVMAGVDDRRRGVVAGLLALSRNLGLITGTSVMGAVFLHSTGVSDLAMARPDAVAAAMRVTFTVAVLLVGAALMLTLVTRHSETVHLQKGKNPCLDHS